jgi:hypothetical protein
MNIKSRTDNLIQRKRNLGIGEIIQLGESGGLLTQSQVAAVMQLSHSTVSRLVNLNQIPYVLITPAGARNRFDLDGVKLNDG